MVEVHKLKNGIDVLLDASSHYSSVAFGVWVKTGSRMENEENNGIAHLIEHMLFKGTKSRNADDISDETAFLGGNLNAYTSKENTSFYVRTLPEYIDRAIDLIGDMLINSEISEKELKKEKQVVCEEIDMYKDSSEDFVHENLQKNVWKNHPLGYYISGKKKIVRSLDRDYIKEYIDNFYVGENIVISVAGKFDKEHVMKRIEEIFGVIKAKGKKKEISAPRYKKVKILKNRDIEQLHMNVALKGPSNVSEDRYAFAVFNAIFGGDVNSRLFREIRENRGLTYSIYSYGSPFIDTGLFQIYGAMSPEQAQNVYDITEYLLCEVRENGVTQEEVDAAVHQLSVELKLSADNVMSRLNSNVKSYMCFGKIITSKDTVKALNKVDKESVNAAVKKYIHTDEHSLGMVGNMH